MVAVGARGASPLPGVSCHGGPRVEPELGESLSGLGDRLGRLEKDSGGAMPGSGVAMGETRQASPSPRDLPSPTLLCSCFVFRGFGVPEI